MKNRIDVTQDQLREYLNVLRRRKWSIALVTLLVFGASIALSMQKEVTYSSTSLVLVKPLKRSLDLPPEAPNMDTEREIAQSPEVLAMVAKKLGADLAGYPVTMGVGIAGGTEILQFTFTHPDPHVAQLGAQTAAESYLKFRSDLVTDEAEGTVGPFVLRREELKDELARVDAALNNSDAIENRTTLKARAEALVGQIVEVEDRISNLNPDFIAIGNIVAPAPLPLSAADRGRYLTWILGLFAGLAAGLAVAFLRDRFSGGLMNQADFENAIGAPVLAIVPRFRRWGRRSHPPVTMLGSPHSPVAEAFGQLRTSLSIACTSRGYKAILITSSGPGEGKSTTAANLAVALANAGKRVILVSADLRKPRLHTMFDIAQQGLTEVLGGKLDASQALSNVGVDNLRVMASGRTPGNPAELLGSPRMADVINELSEKAEILLIDAAPILSVADAVALTPLVDTALFVADVRHTKLTAVDHACRQLELAKVPIVGAVLNNFVASQAMLSHSYYFPYEYAASNMTGRTRRRAGGDARSTSEQSA